METYFLAFLIILLAIGGLALRIIFVKDGEFRGTCATNNPMLKNQIGECQVCGAKPGEQCQNDDEPLPLPKVK
jgi:hypothetical protein